MSSGLLPWVSGSDQANGVLWMPGYSGGRVHKRKDSDRQKHLGLLIPADCEWNKPAITTRQLNSTTSAGPPAFPNTSPPSPKLLAILSFIQN